MLPERQRSVTKRQRVDEGAGEGAETFAVTEVLLIVTPKS
jgi:hypothetical protein